MNRILLKSVPRVVNIKTKNNDRETPRHTIILFLVCFGSSIRPKKRILPPSLEAEAQVTHLKLHHLWLHCIHIKEERHELLYCERQGTVALRHNHLLYLLRLEHKILLSAHYYTPHLLMFTYKTSYYILSTTNWKLGKCVSWLMFYRVL